MKKAEYEVVGSWGLETRVYFDFFFFWPRLKACGILVPRPEIEPVHPAVEAPSPNHCTAREVPETRIYFEFPPSLILVSMLHIPHQS